MDQDGRTLVLSQFFEPLGIISWRRAMTLLFLGRARVIHEYEDQVVHTSRAIFKVPAVIQRLSGLFHHRRPVRYSRENVYARDDFACGYCGTRKGRPNLTIDHILPRALGGKTEWTNVITCCKPCNGRKANRTPEQAMMRLLRRPVKPKWTPAVIIEIHDAPELWKGYLLPAS
jgi:5-methylcytosine-specific restriction endonuclease McrA